MTTPVDTHGCTTEACGYVGAKKNLNKQRLDKGRKVDFHCHITFMCVYKIHMCVTKIEAMYGK